MEDKIKSLLQNTISYLFYYLTHLYRIVHHNLVACILYHMHFYVLKRLRQTVSTLTLQIIIISVHKVNLYLVLSLTQHTLNAHLWLQRKVEKQIRCILTARITLQHVFQTLSPNHSFLLPKLILLTQINVQKLPSYPPGVVKGGRSQIESHQLFSQPIETLKFSRQLSNFFLSVLASSSRRQKDELFNSRRIPFDILYT